MNVVRANIKDACSYVADWVALVDYLWLLVIPLDPWDLAPMVLGVFVVGLARSWGARDGILPAPMAPPSAGAGR